MVNDGKFNRGFLVIDLETTELSEFAQIVEIAVVQYHIKQREDRKLEYKYIDKYQSMVKPLRPITTEASVKNGYDETDVHSAPLPVKVRSELITWWEEHLQSKKFTIIGHNYGNFDSKLMRTFLQQSYDEMFDYHSLDTWNLAYLAQSMGLINVSDLSLDTLSEELEIPHWQHKADGDCKACMAIFVELYNRIVEGL